MGSGPRPRRRGPGDRRRRGPRRRRRHGRGQRRRIRLLEPDAPEISKPRCQNELIQGLNAADRLRALLAGPVEIRRAGRTDRYGRTLASLITPAGNVAEILIAEKRALPYRPGPVAYDDRRRHWCPGSQGKQTP